MVYKGLSDFLYVDDDFELSMREEFVSMVQSEAKQYGLDATHFFQSSGCILLFEIFSRGVAFGRKNGCPF